jgi:hypothetical protein
VCGIPLTLDRDRGRSPLDLCEVIGSQLDLGRPMFSSSRCSLVVPGIGTMACRDVVSFRRQIYSPAATTTH